MASAASTASTSVIFSPRCSTCSAPIRKRAGEPRPRRQATRRGPATVAGMDGPRIRGRSRDSAVSIVDLGLIRCVDLRPDGTLEVGLSPTYVGCPATDVIRDSVAEALRDVGVGQFVVTTVLSPPWSSDWITAEGRRKLKIYGIVPPEQSAPSMREVLRNLKPVACPRCHST